MRPLPFVLPYGVVFLVVFVWAFLPEFRVLRQSRSGAARPHSTDAGSRRIIMWGGAVGFWLALALAFVPPLQFPASLRVAVFVAGLAFIISGSLLRRHCFRMLGRYFTGDVKAEAGQPVIERGAYRWVRHPSYTAGIMMNAGLGLALGSWASTLVLLGTSLAVYSYRMAVEERVLRATLGAPYEDYMRRRKRLIPYVF